MPLSTTILRQDENSAVIMIQGSTGPLTKSFVLHPGGATGPIGATGFSGSTGVGIVSVEKIDWSATGSNILTLEFNGSTDQLIGYFDGNGRIDYYQNYQTKITNSAPGTDSTILLTTTTADPFLILMKVEKTSGFVKVGQYS
jgi:hypothetical protein